MSLANSGLQITLHEKALVPGDFVPYKVLYESHTWQGPPLKRQPKPIPLNVEGNTGGMQFGADPHKDTVDKISAALGSLMDKQMGASIANTKLLNRRDWR
jgi:hypothetical protein